MALGKRGKNAREGLDRNAFYKVESAVDLIKRGATAKFDETVEVAMNLGVDPRQSDQNVRGVVQLPHGTGKSLRVAVFARETRRSWPRKPAPTWWARKIWPNKCRRERSTLTNASRRPT